jgi:hypothetical protein
MEESLPAILELAWAINVRDISKTLKEVCHKIFADASVSHDERLKRAEGIRILGHEFYRIGKAAGGNGVKVIDAEDIKARATVAADDNYGKSSRPGSYRTRPRRNDKASEEHVNGCQKGQTEMERNGLCPCAIVVFSVYNTLLC